MTLTRVVLRHRTHPAKELEILFRQLTDPVPALWKSGYHWQVEAYQRGMEQPPVAIGWVLDVSPGRAAHVAPEDDPYAPDLECVRVFRDYQDENVAHAVIEAARLRWPNLDVQSAVSAEGNGWIASFRALAASQWSVVSTSP